MRSAQSYEYTFSAEVQPAVDRYEALDRQLAERQAAVGDGDMQAFLAFADPRTGATTRDILRTRNLEFGGSLYHLGAAPVKGRMRGADGGAEQGFLCRRVAVEVLESSQAGGFVSAGALCARMAGRAALRCVCGLRGARPPVL